MMLSCPLSSFCIEGLKFPALNATTKLRSSHRPVKLKLYNKIYVSESLFSFLVSVKQQKKS